MASSSGKFQQKAKPAQLALRGERAWFRVRNMFQVIEPVSNVALTLDDYASDPKFTSVVANLRAESSRLCSRLRGRTIWMVNSTAQGGGVAEMLPRLIALMTDLGLSVRWGVIGSNDPAFFALTKRLHNLIHGDGRGGLELTSDDLALYESVNRDNADALSEHLKPQDILIVHDPQPLPLGHFLRQRLALTTLWRCHIGLDQRTDETRAAWRFLRPYLETYQQAIFSAPEYIPSFLAGRAAIVYPALDPLSHKNRELAVRKIVGILCNSGLQTAHHPVVTPEFGNRVKRVLPDGSTALPGEIGLLFRPTVLQVSRWDRLKGWAPLLEAFVRVKQHLSERGNPQLAEGARRRLELSRLVLAGPDPDSISDDPEGLEVFDDICARYRALDAVLQDDVVLLSLPMQSRKYNALIVNALQRCASVVVQNSLREGFGLTVAEAMWKQIAVLGTDACGIRLQVRDRIDGFLSDDPEDSGEIAEKLIEMLINPVGRQLMGRSAQRRVYDEFLIFRQISRYLEVIGRHA